MEFLLCSSVRIIILCLEFFGFFKINRGLVIFFLNYGSYVQLLRLLMVVTDVNYQIIDL